MMFKITVSCLLLHLAFVCICGYDIPPLAFEQGFSIASDNLTLKCLGTAVNTKESKLKCSLFEGRMMLVLAYK